MTFTPIVTPEARSLARTVAQVRANERARALAPLFAEIRASGITTPYTIAAELMRRGIPTVHGRRFWGATQVRNVSDRLDRLSAEGG
jgi:hypothetical protein